MHGDTEDVCMSIYPIDGGELAALQLSEGSYQSLLLIWPGATRL